jgi:hypothetical protein
MSRTSRARAAALTSLRARPAERPRPGRFGPTRSWRTSRRARSWTLLVAVAAVLTLGACGGSPANDHTTSTTAAATSTTVTPSTAAPSGASTSQTTVGAQTASCNLPLTHDTDDGFHIAVPDGWELSTTNGELEVENNVQATEAVLVVPAVQTNSLTASGFFQSQLSTLESQASSEGRTITIQSRSTQNGQPSDSFTAPVNGQQVEGEATVEVLGLGSQLSSTETVFVAYWAPTDVFSTDASMLSEVAQCYGPEQGALYQVFQDQAFTYIMPPGWTVSDESSNNIDLHLDGTADVSYDFAEYIPANEVDSPQTMMSYFLNGVGVDSVQALWTNTSSPQQEGSGTEQFGYQEFTATFNGVAEHGLIYALTDSGSSGTSGVVRLDFSTATSWNSLNGAMIQMSGAIQHNFTQDLQQLQQINQQWQDFSGQVENFDDVLNSQQLVEDPSTGTYYEAPYSSYDVNGPNGPGYYLANGDELNVSQRA